MDRAIAVQGQRALMPSVTHNSPLCFLPQMPQRRLRILPAGQRERHVLREDRDADRRDQFLGPIGQRSMSLVTCTPAARPTRAAVVAAS